LLQSIRPDNPAPEALVFPSPKKGVICESNFGDHAWKTILTQLELTTRDGAKMTLYSLDTFITLQAMQGNSSTTITRWVGNSGKVIEEKYLDKLKLEHLRSTEV